MSEETPNLGGGRPDPPPPTPMMFAGFALAFQVATVIVLVADRCGIATILGIIALVFSAATFFLLLGRRTAASSLTVEEKTRPEAKPGDRPGPGDDRGPSGPAQR